MSATLTVTREAAGIELRRGTFDIELDGRTAGSIDRHQTVDLPLEPGRHTLRLRVGRYSSAERTFDAADGDAVHFRCHGAMMWPRYVVSLAAPGLAISLVHE